MFNFASLIEIFGMLLSWAMGLYVITRSPRSLLSGVAAGTQMSVALYLFGNAMLSNLRDLEDWKAWGGSLWWPAPLALSLWYWTSVIALHRQPQTGPSWYRERVAYVLGAILVLAALAFAVLGVAGDWVLGWSQPEPSRRPPEVEGSWFALGGPGFKWFTAYVAICLVVPLAHLVWAWLRLKSDSKRGPQFGWLTASACLFLIGSGWLAANTLSGGRLPLFFGVVKPGYFFLTAGLVILAWTVVQHGTWLEADAERGDFRYYLTGQGIVVGLYVGLFVVAGLSLDLRSLILLLGLGILALTTHALADQGRTALGRLFFPEAWRLQAKFFNYAQQASRVEDPAGLLRRAASETDEQWWYEQTELALRRLGDPHRLAQHAFIGLLTDENASPLDGARELADKVVQCVAKLEPRDGRPAARPYLILREAYVDGLPTKQIMGRHQIPEKTYFNERKKGVAAIAAELRALERS